MTKAGYIFLRREELTHEEWRSLTEQPFKPSKHGLRINVQIHPREFQAHWDYYENEEGLIYVIGELKSRENILLQERQGVFLRAGWDYDPKLIPNIDTQREVLTHALAQKWVAEFVEQYVIDESYNPPLA